MYYDDDDLEEIDDAGWQQQQQLGQTGSSGSRTTGCPYCGKALRNMTRHIEDVHCPVEIACQLCGKICTSRNKLRTHMAQVCNKRFMAT
jgi:hypothetical protein